MSRSFGDFKFKMNSEVGPESQSISVVPDIHEIDVSRHSHDFMLLGCDGVFEKYPNRVLI